MSLYQHRMFLPKTNHLVMNEFYIHQIKYHIQNTISGSGFLVNLTSLNQKFIEVKPLST